MTLGGGHSVATICDSITPGPSPEQDEQPAPEHQRAADRAERPHPFAEHQRAQPGGDERLEIADHRRVGGVQPAGAGDLKGSTNTGEQATDQDQDRDRSQSDLPGQRAVHGERRQHRCPDRRLPEVHRQRRNGGVDRPDDEQLDGGQHRCPERGEDAERVVAAR